MQSLETLLTELGLTDHMEALSNWRDELLTEKAAELQVLQQKHDALELAQVNIDADRAELAELRPLKPLHDEMVERVRQIIQTGKPEDALALGQYFLMTPNQRRRQELATEMAALDALESAP